MATPIVQQQVGQRYATTERVRDPGGSTSSTGKTDQNASGIASAYLPPLVKQDQTDQGGGGGQGSGQGNGQRDNNAVVGSTRIDVPVGQQSVPGGRLIDRVASTDSVITAIRGGSSFATGSLIPKGLDQINPQGRQIRVAGDVPSDWSAQIFAGSTEARVQTRNCHPNVAVRRYDVIRV